MPFSVTSLRQLQSHAARRLRMFSLRWFSCSSQFVRTNIRGAGFCPTVRGMHLCDQHYVFVYLHHRSPDNTWARLAWEPRVAGHLRHYRPSVPAFPARSFTATRQAAPEWTSRTTCRVPSLQQSSRIRRCDLLHQFPPGRVPLPDDSNQSSAGFREISPATAPAVLNAQVTDSSGLSGTSLTLRTCSCTEKASASGP